MKLINLYKITHQLPVNQVHTFSGPQQYPSTTTDCLKKGFANFSGIKNYLGQECFGYSLLCSFDWYNLTPNIENTFFCPEFFGVGP